QVDREVSTYGGVLSALAEDSLSGSGDSIQGIGGLISAKGRVATPALGARGTGLGGGGGLSGGGLSGGGLGGGGLSGGGLGALGTKGHGAGGGNFSGGNFSSGNLYSREDQLAPRASGEGYRDAGINPMTLTADDPLSTFATDVDTGSFTLSRRLIL